VVDQVDGLTVRYVSDATLRENITRATNMVESYNNFSSGSGSVTTA
jgi:hypothetical protein